MTAPAFGAVDLLTLGADWEPIGVTGALAQQRAMTSGGNGDIIAEVKYNSQQTGQAQYHYIGTEAAFAAAFTAAACWPGKLFADTLFVLSLGIDYDPCARGELPIVSIGLTDGPVADCATPFWYTTALVLPTYAEAAALTVPPILTATAGSAECQSAKWSLSCRAGRSLNKDGEYLSGQGFEGEEKIDLTWVGQPTSITSTGWVNTAGAAGLIAPSSNTGYPTTPYSFVRKVARVTA
jgi:hypothetical protein